MSNEERENNEKVDVKGNRYSFTWNFRTMDIAEYYFQVDPYITVGGSTFTVQTYF